MKKFVDIRYAKSADYRAVLQEIIKDGKCPFCPENFRWHRKPVLRKTGNWVITKASWPYKNSRLHFLIIGKKHKENFPKLALEDFMQISSLLRWAIRKFKILGGGIALRFGDTAYTGATVKHLHFHLVVPEKGKVVNFPIG